MAAGGSLIRDARKMRLSRLRKMRGHGREQLGLKVCSPRMRADTRARGKWPARNAYGCLLGGMLLDPARFPLPYPPTGRSVEGKSVGPPACLDPKSRALLSLFIASYLHNQLLALDNRGFRPLPSEKLIQAKKKGAVTTQRGKGKVE